MIRRKWEIGQKPYNAVYRDKKGESEKGKQKTVNQTTLWNPKRKYHIPPYLWIYYINLLTQKRIYWDTYKHRYY